MKVRMKVAISGLRNGQPWPGIGGVVDLPDHRASELCAAGLATPVADAEPRIEKAIAPEDDVEERDGLTTESASSVVPGKKRGRPPLPRDEHGNVVREAKQ